MKPFRTFFAGMLGVASLLAVTAARGEIRMTGPGTTYFFSTSGDDRNDGLSPGHAKRSLALVPDLLKPGVTIRLQRGDTWNAGASSWDLSGRSAPAGAPMRIASYGPSAAARPVIRVAARRATPWFVLNGTHRLQVEDLELRGGPGWIAAHLDADTRAVRFTRVVVTRVAAAEGTPFEDDGGGGGGGGTPPIYYVSSSDGNDNNDGLSSVYPFKSLQRLLSPSNLLQPGVTVLLKRGDSWYNNTLGDLYLHFPSPSSGTDAMRIGTYGSGARPIVADMYRYPYSEWSAVSGLSDVYRHTMALPGGTSDQVWKVYVDGVPYPKQQVSSASSLTTGKHCVLQDGGSRYIYVKLPSSGSFTAVETIEHADNYSSGGYFVVFEGGYTNLTIQDIEFRGGDTTTNTFLVWAPSSNVALSNLVLKEFVGYGIHFAGGSSTSVHSNVQVLDCTIDKVWSDSMNVEPSYTVNSATGGVTLGANGSFPGGDGIDFSNTNGAVISGNTITNMGHTGIGADVGSSDYGFNNVVIEKNDVSGGSSSYCRAFGISGSATQCTNVRIRRNYFHDLSVSSHLGGYRNYVYSNVFDHQSISTACFGRNPSFIDAFADPTAGKVFQENVIANNTFSGAPVDLWFASADGATSLFCSTNRNRIINNLFLDWSEDHQESVPFLVPCTEWPSTWRAAAGSFPVALGYTDTACFRHDGNGYHRGGTDLSVLVVDDIYTSVNDAVFYTVSQMQSTFFGTGNQFADPKLIGGTGVTRFRPDGDSPFIAGGANAVNLLPSGEAVDYEGAALNASYATRGAFQSIPVTTDAAGTVPLVAGGHYSSGQAIYYTSRPGVTVTLDSASFTSGGTVTGNGSHTIAAAYAGGGTVSWTFSIP